MSESSGLTDTVTDAVTDAVVDGADSEMLSGDESLVDRLLEQLDATTASKLGAEVGAKVGRTFGESFGRALRTTATELYEEGADLRTTVEDSIRAALSVGVSEALSMRTLRDATMAAVKSLAASGDLTGLFGDDEADSGAESTETPDAATDALPDDLQSVREETYRDLLEVMSYDELQSVAKEVDVKANLGREEMVEQIIEELSDSEEGGEDDTD